MKQFFIRNIYFVFLSVLLVGYQQEEQKIPWQENRPLVWEDFKAPVNQGSPYKALTNSGITYGFDYENNELKYTVNCFYDPFSSWVKEDGKTDDLLVHEQGHFNITELYARKIRKKFSETKFTSDNVVNLSESIFKDLMKASIIMQRLYDTETDHNKNVSEQQKWNKKISAELEKLAAYKSE